MQAEPKKSQAESQAVSLVGQEYEVEIGPVAHGGHCIARTSEGQVLFVRHTLPGERVVARVTEGEEGARFLRADAVEILDASKDRIEAPCPFAGPGRCGGCDWQHAKPGAQRRLKGEVVTEQLKRLAGLTPEEAGWDGTVMPAEGDKLPAGQVPSWRTRVQYAVDAEGNAGLRKHRSHEVEPIDHCMIAAEGVSELGIEQRDWIGMESVEAIAASGSQDRQVILTPRPGARLPLVELDRPVSVMRVDEKDGGVHRVHGRPFVRERADDRTYRVGGGGFWQVHPKAADTLVLAVMQGLLPRKGDMALDLYCGVGLFAGAPGRPRRRQGRGPRHRVRQARRRGRPAQPRRLRPRPHRTGQGRGGPAAHRHRRGRPHRPRPAARGSGAEDGRAPVVAGGTEDRVRGMRSRCAGPGSGVLPRRGVSGADVAGVRSVPDDFAC